jgi:hypothetical protein
METHEDYDGTEAAPCQREVPNDPAESSTPLNTQSGNQAMAPAGTDLAQEEDQASEAKPSPQQGNADAPAQPAGANLKENWIQEINRAFGYSTGWVIKTGILLLRAKEQLPHGQWISMFESQKMKFGLRTAEMLMRVALHPVLRNSKYSSSLPSAWSILYLLSQLPADVVEQGILSGAIHVELKLAEARRLLQSAQANVPADPAGPTLPPFDLGRQQARLLRSLRQQGARWPAEYRGELAALLEAMAAELRAAGNAP